ncbi:MAG: VanW family protein [Fimbriimonadales bacterium]
MKKAIFWTAGVLLLAAGGFAGFVTMQEGTTPSGTTLAGVDLSGLTTTELGTRIRTWWQTKKTAVLQPTSHLLATQPGEMSLEQLGIEPDFEATLRAVELQDYADSLLRKEVKGEAIQVTWTQKGGDFDDLNEFVAENAKPNQAAFVKFANGHFDRGYEVPSFGLDVDAVGAAALAAMNSRKPTFELPMTTGDAHVSKEAIDNINMVVNSFSTSFSAGNINRSHNIRLAAESLNGAVLMPGDTLSYNETVGRRTAKNGYKMAGVYANGRHEVDYGGGICQVSTTLFNAVALSNLEIVNRSNHSMPVPYVPVGRDATVDYDKIDFKFRNNYDTPIAISSEVAGGNITFYVLGSQKMDFKVRMETSGHSSWGNSIKYVTDNSLSAGRTKVIEKGSMGRKCTTWKIVEKDGVEVSREKMFDSIYRASPRIVARGSRAASKPKPEVPADIPPAEPTDIGG